MPTPAVPQKKIANKVLTTLDNTCKQLETLAQSGKIDKRLAASIVRDIDTFADKFEVAVYGQENLQKRASQVRQAKVLQMDADEKYMGTFENPIKPITTDADEPYMHKAEHGYNSTKDMETYDADISSSVHDRDEYTVRDLNEFSPGTKKQPSWEGGPAGKSTAIGSAPARRPQTAGAPPAAAPAPRAKTWAP
jgi:hypothetical protein